MPEESEVESCEHQDNANIHCQPFPESVSEEHEIYTDYDGYHRHHVKHDSYLSAHFSLNSLPFAAIFFFAIRLHVLFRRVRLLVTDSAYFASLLHYE